MIRLLERAFVPSTRTFLLPLLFSCSYKNKKGAQVPNNGKEEKGVKIVRLNWGQRNSKNKKPETGKKQEGKKEGRDNDAHKKYKDYKFKWNIPALIDPQILKVLQANLSFPPYHTSKLAVRWKQCMSSENHYQFTKGIYDLLRIMLPHLVNLSAQISPDLVNAYMEGYFCSHHSLNQPVNHLKDLPYVEFFTRNQTHIEAFYLEAGLRQQLRFYAIIKDLTVRRAGQGRYRDLVSKYHFIYRPLLQNMQKVDFSSDEGFETIEIFSKCLKYHPLNSEDEKLVNCICSQVPFFLSLPLFRFLQEHAWLLQKADPAIVLSVLQATKLQGFNNLPENQFYCLIRVFASLNRKLPQITAEVEQILGLIFAELITQKHSRSLVLETLAELANYVQLKQGAVGSNQLFSFLKTQLEAIAFLKCEQDARRQANIFFEVLSIMLNNKFIRKDIFPSELKVLQATFQRIASRVKILKKSYLWNLLHGQYGQLQVFNAVYFLQLSPHKQVDYIHQLIQLNDIKSTKSLISILIDCTRQPLLLSLKRMLPEYDYQKILKQLNLSLIDNNAVHFYRDIVWELLGHVEFAQIMIDLVENLQAMEKEGLNQRIVKLMLSACYEKIDRREPYFRKNLESLLYVLVYYINDLREAQLLLALPNFYLLIISMLSFLSSTKKNTYNEFKINAYRMLSFILSADTPTFNQILEPSIRNFTISPQDSERFKYEVNNLERNISYFKLKFLIPAHEVTGIYDNITEGTLRPPEAQVNRIHKLYSHKWLPKHINKHTLVAFFMDDNVTTILNDYMPEVQKIVQEATVQQVAFFIYNFNSHSSVFKSSLFQFLWVVFLQKLQVKDIPYLLSLHILSKYFFLEDKYYLSFLLKVLEFYSENPAHLTRAMHINLFQYIKYRFRSVTVYPPPLNNYIATLRRLIANQWSYLSYIHKFSLLEKMMSLGFPLTELEINAMRPRIFEHDFSFYYFLLSEDSLPNEIQSILKQYFRNRSKMKIKDLPVVYTYIQMKYPSLKRYLKYQGVIPSSLMQMGDKQKSGINRLYSRYKGLELRNTLYCVTNEKHLIAFHPSDKMVLLFLQKLYAIQPTIKHLQVHIFDLSEFSRTAEFYAKIEALGIVGAKKEGVTEVEQNDESPQQKLVKAIAKYKHSHTQQLSRQRYLRQDEK